MTVVEDRPEAPPPTRQPQRHAADVAIRIVAALATAAAICGFAWTAYPDALDIRTDIVGYPIVQDFNAPEYTFRWALIAVAFPVIAILVWSLLELLARRRSGDPGRPLLPAALPSAEPEPVAAGGARVVTAYAKECLVGFLLAAAVAVAIGAPSSWPLTLGLPITAVYVGLCRLVGGVLSRRSQVSRDEGSAAMNAIAASASLLVLAATASASHVDITTVDRSVDYPIAPVWALIVVGLIPVAVVGLLVSRGPAGRWHRIETWTLLLVAAPAAIYLGLGHVPGELPPPDLFHEGERIGASHLVFDLDEFPWRDILFIHGVLSDVLFPRLDLVATELSRWGLTAGQDLVERPLFWLSTFALCVYLFRRNWLFLIGASVLIVFGWVDALDNTRMILVPLSLLALALLLERSTWPRAFLLMGVTVTQAIAVPEATVYSAAVWGVMVLYELVHRHVPGTPTLGQSRTVRCLAAGVALLALFFVFLIANDSVDGFESYYRTFVAGHGIAGAFPFQWGDLEYHVWVYIPVAAVLVGWAYAAGRVWTRRWFTKADWVIAPAFIGLIPYYTKFLARADSGHLYQVATVAFVPALYVVYRVVQALDARAARSGVSALRYRPATVACLLLVLALAPTSVASLVRNLPDEYVGVASTEPPDSRLGYIIPGDDEVLIRRTQAVVDRYAPDGKVFDFTNSPLLFDFLVDDRPVTRFFHVSMALPRSAQEDLIDELRDSDPALIAYSSREQGLPSWDVVSNPVRHYLVSDYLLDHYHPVAKVEDYVFMARNEDPAAPPEVGDPRSLLFEGLPCEWGYAPNFLNQTPADAADGIDLTVTKEGLSTGVGGWAVDEHAGVPAVKVLIAAGDRIVASTPTGVRRDDVASQLGSRDVIYAGYEFRGKLPERYAAHPEQLSYFGVSRDGVASQLGVPANPPPAALRGPRGATIPVRPGAVRGSVDYVLPAMDRYRLDSPPGRAAFDWLSLTSAAAAGGSRVLISDGNAAGARTIGFNELPGSDGEQIRVGSCPQWKGYGEGPIYVDVTHGSGELSARLIR